jgi:putative membrane protein
MRALLLASALLLPALLPPAAAAQSNSPLQPLINLFGGSVEVGPNTFVEQAAIADMYEIEASTLILQRSTHPQIRDYAQRMIEMHTMMARELRALPEGATRMPAGLNARRQNQLIRLRQYEGDELNRWYVQEQIDAHTEAEALYQGYAEGGDVPALKAFAQKYLPEIRAHLAAARALQAPRAAN